MTNFEMVERLRTKTNVSYEEAKAALEASNWDLLDAMVKLEQEGKIKDGAASFTTKEEPKPSEEKPGSQFKSVMRKIGEKLVNVINYLTRNSLEISKKDKVILTVPVIVPVLCLLPWFWPVLILLVVGLFTGFKYTFRGPDLGGKPINDVMGKASDMAENIKSEVKSNTTDKSDEDDDAQND